ncbi:hypothetical protein PAXRUDRAFT_832718 [Paxillus rubicundulus Ve08.2h10]|uniref:Uncharacterized protein n=1 Tax=Paxillus rubicundulus Ve08.2h10 TaxID=930991 RepID=A0A0D0CFW1_9AGAM|nr:hypothetical protein PAXRUDRAFT_832718 [Paxillus rubicundulus Ve08.2h10]
MPAAMMTTARPAYLRHSVLITTPCALEYGRREKTRRSHNDQELRKIANGVKGRESARQTTQKMYGGF